MAGVRLAGKRDSAALARLFAAFRDWWERGQPQGAAIAEGVERLLEDPDSDLLLALGEDGEPAGFAALRYRYVVWVAGEECELEDLFVDEAARGTGLGRALVEAAVERACARGCGRMQLNTNEANPAALALYESAGLSAWFDPPGGRNLNLRLEL